MKQVLEVDAIDVVLTGLHHATAQLVLLDLASFEEGLWRVQFRDRLFDRRWMNGRQDVWLVLLFQVTGDLYVGQGVRHLLLYLLLAIYFCFQVYQGLLQRGCVRSLLNDLLQGRLKVLLVFKSYPAGNYVQAPVALLAPVVHRGHVFH